MCFWKKITQNVTIKHNNEVLVKQSVFQVKKYSSKYVHTLGYVVSFKFFKNSACVATRVTRLSEFSPYGRYLPLGSFIQIAEVAQSFGYLFPKLRLCINFDEKNGLGNIVGDFVTNCHRMSQTGHSGCNSRS
jgi:hypothetical protein